MESKRRSRRKPSIESGSGAYVFEALEPRVLLSADPFGASIGGGLALDVLDKQMDPDVNGAGAVEAFLQTLATHPELDAVESSELPPSLDLDGLSLLAGSTTQDPEPLGVREVVFVDARTPDHQQLLDDLREERGGRTFEVFILDSDRDGIEQISEVLGDQNEVDAVHIVSHGTDGGVQLGNAWLTWDRVTPYADSIEGWSEALTDEADLLFYGCNLTGSARGQALIESVARLSGADVAASDDLTGHRSLGGDWDLEYATGSIETAVAPGASFQQNWGSVLAPPVFTEIGPFTVDEGAAVGTVVGDVDAGDGDARLPGPSGLIFSELMVNPASPEQDAEWEWVELYNLGSEAVDLTGFVLDDINSLDLDEANILGGTVAAGETAVLYNADALSAAEFQAAWGPVTNLIPVSDWEDLQLNNAGDQLSLWQSFADYSGDHQNHANAFLTVNYDVLSPWPAQDGAGSIYLTDLSKDLNQGSKWALSTVGAAAPTGGTAYQSTAAGGNSGADVGSPGDGGAGSGVTYSITTNTDPDADANDAFAIDPLTGVITVNDSGDLDYEGTRPLNITVQADDGVDQTTTNVTIQLNDLNDQLTASNVDQTKSYTEDAASVALDDIIISDADSGENVTASLTLADPAAGSLTTSGTATYDRAPGVWTITGPVGQVNAALAQVAFIPASDYDQDTTIAVNIADGGENSAVPVTGTITLDVTPVQDAPTASDRTVVTPEDINYAFRLMDFGFSDVDGESLAQIQITGLESNGKLQLSGVDVALNDVIDAADIAAGNLRFVPVSNANGVGYDSFQFKVHDGIEYSAGTYTMTIDVTPVIDPPTASDNTIVTDEDIPYTFGLADFNFSDVDGESLAQIQITALESEGSLQLSGVDVALSDVIDAADISAGNLKFVPALDANGAPYDSFQFKVHDGTAYSLNDYTMTVDVTPVNDAPPTAADSTVVTNEDTTYTFALTDFNFSDVDGESLAQIQITGLESNGKLQLSGMDVALNDVIAAADISAGNLKFIPALDANGSPYDSFQFKVSDGTDYSVSTYTMTVDVTPVDDGPIAGTNTVVTDEDTTHIFSLPDFNFADITITTLTEITITGLESKGSLQLSGVDVAYSDVITKEEITAGQLKFIPALDANGSPYDSFQFKWHDGSTYSASNYAMNVDVTAINDAPTGADNIVTTDEDTTYTFTAADVTFADVDTANSLKWLQITALESNGSLQLNGFDVVLNQMIDVDDINAGKLKFIPAPDANGIPYASFQFKVSDGTDYSVSTYTMTVDVTPVNDDLPTGADNTVVTDEDVAYTFARSDFGFSDADGDSFAQIQVTSLESRGWLTLNGVDVGLTDVITAADITAGNLKYTPAPDANGAGYDSFQFRVHDGTDYSAAAYTMTVDVRPVQDAPTASDSTVTTPEDTAYVFRAVDFRFADVDGETLQWVQITGLETAGALEFSGAPVNLNDIISVAEINAGKLKFIPALDANGLAYDSFQFKVHDGIEYSGAYSMTVDVIPANDAPSAIVLSNAAVDDNTDTSAGYSVGTLSATDPDSGDTVSYTIVGGIDAYKFSIGGAGSNELILTDGVLDHGVKSSYRVTVRVTDSGGLGHDETFNINVSEPPVILPGPPSEPPLPDPEPDPEPAPSNDPPADEDVTETSGADGAETRSSTTEAEAGAVTGGGELTEFLIDAPAELGVFGDDETQQGPRDPGDSNGNGDYETKTTLQSIMDALAIKHPLPALDLGAVGELFSGKLDDAFSLGEMDGLVRDLDGVREELAGDVGLAKALVGSGIVASTGLSVGYALWLARGGLLLSTVLSSLPAWRLVDPLPVLSHLKERPEDEDDEDLESMVTSSPGGSGNQSDGVDSPTSQRPGSTERTAADHRDENLVTK